MWKKIGGFLLGILFTVLGLVLYMVLSKKNLDEIQKEAEDEERKRLDAMPDPDVVNELPDPGRVRDAGRAGSTVGRNQFYNTARQAIRRLAGQGRDMGSDPGSGSGDQPGSG